MTTSKNAFKLEVKDRLIDEFTSILTITKIKHFNSQCKQKHLEMKNLSRDGGESKLRKDTFLSLMKNIFTSSLYDLDQVFELLFRRFKIVKCEIKSDTTTNKSDLYYINDIFTEEKEIDVYEIACALCVFLKCDYKEKMQLLFDITDVDEDGYVNEQEIINMIFCVNFIFSDEDSQLRTKSSVINQSLATIKSQQVFNSIMRYPGELYKIIAKEKYVTFNQFYESIEKIPNFKYTIIPSFINVKYSLNRQKSEPEYEMEKKNISDFLSISHDIVSNVKTINSEIIKRNKDIKKLTDNKNEHSLNKVAKKKVNFVDSNIKQMRAKGKRFDSQRFGAEEEKDSKINLLKNMCRFKNKTSFNRNRR
jgi:hypothetical protein